MSRAFYARVDEDSLLRPLFPGKSLRCATEELSAYLIQFFGGDEAKTQYRWWLSLRESHSRFELNEQHRIAWVGRMRDAMEEVFPDSSLRATLQDFFFHASAYILGEKPSMPNDPVLVELWQRQLALDDLIQDIKLGADSSAIEAARAMVDRPSVLVGVLACMLMTGRRALLDFALRAVRESREISRYSYNGRPLLHQAAAAGCDEMVSELLNMGVDPNLVDTGGHTALYRCAGAKSEKGGAVVRVLVAAGADPNLRGGVALSTPLHEAARQGNVDVANALIAAGADPHIPDGKGRSPRDRAMSFRKLEVLNLMSFTEE